MMGSVPVLDPGPEGDAGLEPVEESSTSVPETGCSTGSPLKGPVRLRAVCPRALIEERTKDPLRGDRTRWRV